MQLKLSFATSCQPSAWAGGDTLGGELGLGLSKPDTNLACQELGKLDRDGVGVILLDSPSAAASTGGRLKAGDPEPQPALIFLELSIRETKSL